MSNVTNILVQVLDQKSDIEKINDWLTEHEFEELTEIPLISTTSKSFEIELYGNAYNYFPNEEFIQWFDKCRDFKYSVQLLIEDQDNCYLSSYINYPLNK